ncbi:unnamed protein product [Zymoseptoria tritici ST99CH_1A5]|uniref:AD domain-containing protein n=1 Tax=Zymoseptoria tritici ST99CH_1A5 TaxID=1276529 RepID=A0A1Y6LSD7_ZYMTR|nr:unnamed protein product [Zymoseptoria tritici ST99CH_1A5]
MADTAAKRNSIAGKIATPKIGGGSSPATSSLDSLEVLSKAIGCRIKITTAAPHSQTYEGTLFNACPVLHVIAINTRAPPPNPASNAAAQPGDYHIIPFSRIQSSQVISLAGAEGVAQPVIGAVDIRQLQKREETRVNQLREEEESRGKGVSKEAQAIFDSFRRINVPVRWHNQEIIVLEHVIVVPPYRPEDCKASKDKQETLIRVRKILEGERKKLQEKEARERSAASNWRRPRILITKSIPSAEDDPSKARHLCEGSRGTIWRHLTIVLYNPNSQTKNDTRIK